MAFDPLALLKQVFPGMGDEVLEGMASLAKMTTYPSGTILCHEGEMEEVFYIMGEGQAVVWQQLGREERFLRNVGPGQYFGEMALIANSPRNANVRTTVESSFLEVDKEIFIEMLRQNPVIALTMFQTTVGWLRANDHAAIQALSAQKEEIERAYFALQLQEERRSEFLTSLAHELRTPLTSASGYMQLIKHGTLNGDGLQMGLEKIGSGLERIVSLVNDLLFVQEMELIEPTMRIIDLPAIVKTLIDEAVTRASVSGLNLAVNIPSDLPDVQADPDGLRRALRALIDNAIKFSPNGGIIRIDVTTDEDYIDIAIMDPGVGIPPEIMPRIFERFVHQDRHAGFVFEGIGLGLSIARHLVESFGGNIFVESEVDQGSRFTVRLPVLAQSQSSNLAESGKGLA